MLNDMSKNDKVILRKRKWLGSKDNEFVATKIESWESSFDSDVGKKEPTWYMGEIVFGVGYGQPATYTLEMDSKAERARTLRALTNILNVVQDAIDVVEEIDA